MAVVRKYLVDEERSGCYYLISRCVRRAFLCGDQYEHRKQWILERLRISKHGWIETMCSSAQFSGTAIGSAFKRAQEAARRGVRCIIKHCSLYHEHSPPG